jgi:hypothetical protein
MKAKLVMLTLLATSTLAHATLIDLTPGGFSVNNPPPAYLQFLKQWLKPATFLIAGANINGSQVDWSPFCLFGPANFSIDSQRTNALVGWNLADTNGYFMQYVLVEGQGGFDNLYGITGQSFRFNGMGFVTIDGQIPFQAIVFFGTNIVPETLNSFVAFAIAVVGLLLTYKVQRRRIA